ncbi:MAG: hypothetical protein ACK47B_13090 [Armatimonadota bacterium]
MESQSTCTGTTVLAVEPVQSRAACTGASSFDVQLTFDAYRSWVEERLVRHGGEEIDWTADAAVAWFPTARQAVAAARTLVDEIGDFNRELNVVSQALQVRIGIDSPAVPRETSGGFPAPVTRDAAIYLRQAARPNEVLLTALAYARLGSHVEGFGRVPEALGDTPAYAYPPRPTRSYRIDTRFLRGFRTGSGRLAAAAAGTLLVLLAALAISRLGAGSEPAPEVAREPPIHLTPASPPGNRPPPRSLPGTAQDSPGELAPDRPYGSSPREEPGSGAPSPAVEPGPATALWRSPEAESSVPARFIPAPPERKWLLAIGVGAYQSLAFNAPGAADDAREAVGALAAAAGIPADHVLVLTDAEATGDGIRQAVRALQSRAVSGKDTVYVYLAGAAVPASLPSDGGTRVYAFAPHDADPDRPVETLVYGSDLLAWLGALRAQEIVLIADTDYAAALGTVGGVDPGRRFALLAGTTAEQKTYRFPEGSAFASSLESGLRGRADRDGDRLVTLEELRAWLAADVPQRTRGGQTPTLASGFGGSAPELVFALPPPR